MAGEGVSAVGRRRFGSRWHRRSHPTCASQPPRLHPRARGAGLSPNGYGSWRGCAKRREFSN
eukprot:6828251-Pyramimonas_sp.AAC.1